MERHKLYSLTLFFLDKEEPHPSSKLKLWMGPENLGASHCDDDYYFLFTKTSISQSDLMRLALYRIFWSEVCKCTPQRQKNSKLAKIANRMQK